MNRMPYLCPSGPSVCRLTSFENIDFETSSPRRGEVPEKPFVNLDHTAKLSELSSHCEAK